MPVETHAVSPEAGAGHRRAIATAANAVHLALEADALDRITPAAVRAAAAERADEA